MIVTPNRSWYCPNCPLTLLTHDAAIPLHACRGLHGLTYALLPVGTRAAVRVVEREDYIGSEQGVRMVEQRPIMSVVTERDNGLDAVVYAPTATAQLE